MAEGHFNWTLTIIIVIAVILGSQLGGSFMSGKAKPKWVKSLDAAVLFAIAIKLFLEALQK